MVLSKIKKGIKNPNIVIRKVWMKCTRFIPNDKIYLSVVHFLSHGKKMNWNDPRTFNEKTQWLKLWSKGKGFEKYVDKYEIREYVRQKLGEEYLIPLLGVWNTYDEIDFDSLPDDFVLKTTHDSGGIVIVKGKNIPDSARSFLNKRLRKNYFYGEREYPYKGVTPRIIAEKLMVDESGWDLKDYKFFCFNGEPRILFLASERFKSKGSKAKFDYFDMDLCCMPFISKGHQSSYTPGEKHAPIPGFEEMKALAKKLSQGFPFVRVDFYNINGKVYFGEMTFFHDAGVVPFIPNEWDLKLGEMIDLPQETI